MNEMGKAMMGTGEAEGDSRALQAAEKAIANPLLDEISLKGARGVLINVTGGYDLTLFELDEAANRIREEVDPEANIIVGSTLDTNMEGQMRVSVVATGIDLDRRPSRPRGRAAMRGPLPAPRAAEAAEPARAYTPEPQREVEPEPDDAQRSAARTVALRRSRHGRDGRGTGRGRGAAARLSARAGHRRNHRVTIRVRQPVTMPTRAAFVVPKPAPAGKPTPEALARLRAAIQKDAPRANRSGRCSGRRPPVRCAAPVPVRPQLADQPHEPGMPKRHRRRPSGDSRRCRPPPPTVPPRCRLRPRMTVSSTPEQERIEIPAFLRRQAN